MFAMVLQMVGVNQNIIKVYDDEYVSHIKKNVAHKILEHCWHVSETERHDKIFEKTIASAECGLPFVTLSDMSVVVADV